MTQAIADPAVPTVPQTPAGQLPSNNTMLSILGSRGYDVSKFQTEEQLADAFIRLVDYATQQEQAARGAAQIAQMHAMQNGGQPTGQINVKDWLQYFGKDANGQIVPRPEYAGGLSPQVINEVRSYYGQREQHLNGLADDPVKYLMPQMQDSIQQMIQQGIQQGLAEHQRQQSIDQWISKHGQWLYQGEGDQRQLTPQGQRISEIAAQLRDEGVKPEFIQSRAVQLFQLEALGQTFDLQASVDAIQQQVQQQQQWQEQITAQAQQFAQQPPHNPAMLPPPNMQATMAPQVGQFNQQTPVWNPNQQAQTATWQNLQRNQHGQWVSPQQGGMQAHQHQNPWQQNTQLAVPQPQQSFVGQAGINPGAWHSDNRSGDAAADYAVTNADVSLDAIDSISAANMNAAGISRP